ncbi:MULTISPECIES: hypothetical protein [Rhizobium]|uniref:hypothetical protein n=1 Tax=Rhizobium TaxID=379 RepID=UPI001FE01962|nr:MULTISPECIES: hypothetical protein [Rhizobium]
MIISDRGRPSAPTTCLYRGNPEFQTPQKAAIKIKQMSGFLRGGATGSGVLMVSDSGNGVVVRRIIELPDHFDQFLVEADAEGFDTMSVLQNEWFDGSNRFERSGEILALATHQ